jgi:tetraprenyl-beta-curcumene synthase
MSPEAAILLTRGNRAARGGRVRLFASAAGRYWFGVYPAARSVQRRLLARAEAIPDPLLRADALASHHDKGSNSEGLAALAVLAPKYRRAEIARSLVAYQLMLDYLDGVSERPSEDPLANGFALHRAFEVALDPNAAEADFYLHAPASNDGGYLLDLIETCRAPLRELPSYQAARGPLLRQARLCCESQALNHALRFAAVQGQLNEWAGRTAAESELEPGFEWWELIAAAAASAYFPWASGLNALLDSLVDLDEDPEDASHVRRYDSFEHAAERLTAIASGARERVSALPDGDLHEAILAAMGSLYLVHEGAWRPGREPISLAVYGALGPLARPSLAVHLLRRGGRGSRALLTAKRSRARL